MIRYCCMFLLMFTANELLAQKLSTEEDLAMVMGKNFQGDLHLKKYTRAGNDTKLIEVKKKSTVAQYNPVSLVMKGTMFVYQQVLSPQLSRSCPYEITCSNFSKQSIQSFGMIKGVFLSADRVLRCNRIGLLDVPPLSYSGQNGSISDSPKEYTLK